jgi:putative transposase
MEIRALSQPFAIPQVSVFSMSTPISNGKKKPRQSVSAESPPRPKKTTSKGKSNKCHGFSPDRKSSEISDLALTGNALDLGPYWNEQCKEINSTLWLPIGTDWLDSSPSLSQCSTHIMGGQSWFSTKVLEAASKNELRISLPSLTPSAVECTEDDDTLLQNRVVRIRLYPTAVQRAILRKWFGTCRYVYNQTIAYLKQPRTVANWKKVAKLIFADLPEWSKETPYAIKTGAIKEACRAVKNAKAKFLKTGEYQEVKFRNRRNPKQSFEVRASAITKEGVYHTLLGSMKMVGTIPDTVRDSRFVLYRGQYFLLVPARIEISSKSEGSDRTIALDPGIRTFLTFFSPDACGKIGDQDFQRIARLCRELDDLVSRMALVKAKHRYRMRKAANRIRTRIANLVGELHKKAAKWLTDNYDVIFLPTFKTSEMAVKSQRKLKSKSVRSMLTFRHYQFQQRLIAKAKQKGKVVMLVNEAYTSKTVSWTGEVIDKLGGRKVIRSLIDGRVMDRDINGARGIFLRALVDTPSLLQIVCQIA